MLSYGMLPNFFFIRSNVHIRILSKHLLSKRLLKWTSRGRDWTLGLNLPPNVGSFRAMGLAII